MDTTVLSGQVYLLNDYCIGCLESFVLVQILSQDNEEFPFYDSEIKVNVNLTTRKKVDLFEGTNRGK